MRDVLGRGALGRPRGIGWRGRWEGGSGWGTHVTPWLIHVNVWQNPLQCCEVISLQLIKINEAKKKGHCAAGTVEGGKTMLQRIQVAPGNCNRKGNSVLTWNILKDLSPPDFRLLISICLRQKVFSLFKDTSVLISCSSSRNPIQTFIQ